MLSDSVTIFKELAEMVSSSLSALGFFKVTFHSLAVGSAGLASLCSVADPFRLMDVEVLPQTAVLSMRWNHFLVDLACSSLVSNQRRSGDTCWSLSMELLASLTSSP